MSFADDTVHRLAAKMTSADHDTVPVDRPGATAGESADGAVHGAVDGVVDLTGTGTADPGTGDEGDLDVIDLDTYEAAHHLALEADQRG